MLADSSVLGINFEVNIVVGAVIVVEVVLEIVDVVVGTFLILKINFINIL